MSKLKRFTNYELAKIERNKEKIGFIYILSCYPILFLGANKGQQSNDLLYSTLLPIRKKDIVKECKSFGLLVKMM